MARDGISVGQYLAKFREIEEKRYEAFLRHEEFQRSIRVMKPEEANQVPRVLVEGKGQPVVPMQALLVDQTRPAGKRRRRRDE